MCREIVTLQVGQAGNQVGTQFWDALRKEHGINAQGKLASVEGESESSEHVATENSTAEVMFNPTSKEDAKWVPRGILIDLEPSTLDDVRNHHIGGLFRPANLIFGHSGAGNNWAKGHYTEGPELIENIQDRARREVESCDCPQGFQLIHSLGGGTGSGLGTLVLSALRDCYPDRITCSYSIFPSQSVSGTVVEPYNAILSIHQLLENSDMSFILDNEALHNVATNTLNVKKPGYTIMNQLVSQVLCGVTASLRFPGTLNADLRKLGVNLVPFPRIHFYLSSQGPISDRNTSDRTKLNIRELVTQCFSTRNMFCRMNPGDGKYIAAAMMFRGENIAENEVDDVVAQRNQKCDNEFIEWIPHNLQTSIIRAPSTTSPLSATLVSNHTGLCAIFQRISHQFGMLYRRKAFLHFYKDEGMDEMEFQESDKNVRDLITEYQDINGRNYDPDGPDMDVSDEEDYDI